MKTILIVDDSSVERKLAAGLLSGRPDFQFDFAENGRDALDHMRRRRPDLVLTDLVMPEMDGLALLMIVRIEYPDVPVILMTAYGSESIAVEALHQGAASYVPKARRAESLAATVEQVLTRARVETGRQRVLDSLSTMSCSFALKSDPALIEPLVDMIQRAMAGVAVGDETGRMRAALALEESLRNALYHGNLELEAGGEIHIQDVPNLARQRQAQHPFCERTIHLDVELSHERARFVVRDGGKGFDPEAVRRRAVDRFGTGEARGLTLIYSLMDDVALNDRGNEIAMASRCRSGGNGTARRVPGT